MKIASLPRQFICYGAPAIDKQIAAKKLEVDFVTFQAVQEFIRWKREGEGKPIEVAFPASDPLPIWGQLGAIFKDAPHPNAARLYLQRYMAKEQQSRIGTWSARNDVPPPFGLKPILDYNVANDLAEIVTDPARLAELRKRFEGYTGDVKNKGGIR